VIRRDYEYIVMGLGGLGSAAAYWLSRQSGADVLGLEQFELGHVRGESQDHSRIIRLSYHTPGYVELAKQAYAAWDVLEKDSKERVILQTGGLDFAPRVSAIPLDSYSDSMKAAGVAFEHLDAAEIMRRWPQFQLTDDIHGLYQERSGIAMAARANAAHQRMAREHGASLVDRAPVERLRSAAGEIDVEAGAKSYRCRRLAIAAGPWSNQALANFGVELPLEVTQEQVTYFASPRRREFMPDRFPVWIWMDDPCYYGFPTYGEPTVKVAEDCGGAVVTGESRSFEPDPDRVERLRRFTGQLLPAAGAPLRSKTCLYTLTPDRDFVLDTVPGHDAVVVGLGAAHGFKFTPTFGRLLAELAVSGECDADVSGFQLDRPALTEAGHPQSWLV